MHITVNTAEEISDLDRQVLALLAGTHLEEVKPAAKPAPEEKVEKPTSAKKAAKKAAKKPEPEPKPDPIAEEPLEEEEELPDEEESDDVDETTPEELLELAIQKGTKMVADGKAAQVREALEAAGASRVRELNTENVRAFFNALP